MKRLLAFLAAVAVVESSFYSALTPLLPGFEHDFSLSKAQAGLLVGMFAIGMVVAAPPIGFLASSVGVKRSALAGLLVLAAASIFFGLADNFGELLAIRFVQGAAGAICWASALAWLVEVAPAERRGEMIGILSGAGAAGAMVGPAVGGLASLVGRTGAFAGMAGAAVLLALVGSSFSGHTGTARPSVALVRTAHASRAVLGMQWLVAAPGLLLGMALVLAPLQFSRLGWGAIGIAGTYLCAALGGVAARPWVGRWADRRGRLGSIRLLLFVAVPVTVLLPWIRSPWVLAVLVVLTIGTYGVLWGPAMALLSHLYQEAGIPQVFGFALMNMSAGVGIIAGSAVGGAIAEVAGDETAYALAAGACLATALVLGGASTREARAMRAGRVGAVQG